MLNDESSNSALTAQEKCLYSRFFLDHKLPRSGKSFNITFFLLLDMEKKITKTVPSPNNSSKTKNSTSVGRLMFKLIKTFQTIVHHDLKTNNDWHANEIPSISDASHFFNKD